MFSVEENSVGLLLGGRRRRRRRAQEHQRQDHGHCGTHCTSPVRPAPPIRRAQKKNRAWPFCGAAASFAGGTFRGAGGYGKTIASRICRRTSMGRSILVAVVAAARPVGDPGRRAAQQISQAPRPYVPPLVGTRAAAGERTPTAPPTFRASASGTSRRAGPRVYGYRAPVYGYCRTGSRAPLLRDGAARSPLGGMTAAGAGGTERGVPCLSRRP